MSCQLAASAPEDVLPLNWLTAPISLFDLKIFKPTRSQARKRRPWGALNVKLYYRRSSFGETGRDQSLLTRSSRSTFYVCGPGQRPMPFHSPRGRRVITPFQSLTERSRHANHAVFTVKHCGLNLRGRAHPLCSRGRGKAAVTGTTESKKGSSSAKRDWVALE